MTVFKVYLNWANSILKERDSIIEGIGDIQAGKVLCQLIDILTPNTAIFSHFNEIEDVDAHAYIETALNHIKENGIKLNFSVQDIIDGDIKSMLDCLWQIILHYSIHSIEQNVFRRTVGIGKRNLLDWCQKQLNTFFDGRCTIVNNLCADNWFIILLERFTDISKSDDKLEHLTNLLKEIEVRYGIVKEIILPGDILDGTADEHSLMIYIALLRRQIDENPLNNSEVQQITEQESDEAVISPESDSSLHASLVTVSVQPDKMDDSETTVRDTIGENIKEYMKEDQMDGSSLISDSHESSIYPKEEEKPIILKRPTDYYNSWENSIDRLSQSPLTTASVIDINTTPEDILLNIDDFNDSFDKSRSNNEQLYKPDYTKDDRKLTETQRSESRSPTRIIDRYQAGTRREYRHSPEPRSASTFTVKSEDSGLSSSSERKSRSAVRFHSRRDDRSPSPEAYTHIGQLKQARKSVDKNMPKEELAKRSRSDDRDYKKSDDGVSQRTKALRLRASASLGRENRIRQRNQEMQKYNNNITEEMVKNNLGLTNSSSQLADPVNVITPLRHIGSAERIYKDEDSTFVKLLDIQRNPPQAYELGVNRIPRKEEWERRRDYITDEPYHSTFDIGGHQRFLGSLDDEIDKIDDNIETLQRSRRLPRFSSTGNINDRLWSQEFHDISEITNPYHSLYNIHNTERLNVRSRSLSPSRITIPTYERPRSSLGVCQPNYNSTFRYENVGLGRGKYADVPLGRFDVRTNYYNPNYGSSSEDLPQLSTSVTRATSMSPTRQSIGVEYSSPIRRVNDEIWGSDLAEIDGLDPNRQEKWKRLINLTDMTNEDVIELKQALASAIVENDILFAKLINAKKEFSEKLLKTNEVLDDCRKHLATAQAENQELRTFLNQEKRINAALEARIKELEEHLSVSSTNCKQYELRLEETVIELESLREEIMNLEHCQQDNEKLDSKNSLLERDNTALKYDLERMQDTHEKSQCTIHEIRKCLEEVRKERHQLYDEVSRLQFKERYQPGERASSVESSIPEIHVGKIDDTTYSTPKPVRMFKPIIETPQASPVQPSPASINHHDIYTSYHPTTSTVPVTETTSTTKERISHEYPSRSVKTSTRPATTNVQSKNITNERRSNISSTMPTTSVPTRSYTPVSRTIPSDPIINKTTNIQDTTPVTINHTPRFSSPSRDHIPRTTPLRTTSPRRTTSPLRTTSPIRSRLNKSNFDSTYNYKPSSSSVYNPVRRTTSPFKYHDITTTVPSSYREIYPHRKSRYSSNRSSDYDYESRKTSSTNNFTDYPDLQQYPTRLRHSNSDNNLTSRQYTSSSQTKDAGRDYTPNYSSNYKYDNHITRDDDGFEEEFEEYEYTKKVTTISDNSSSEQRTYESSGPAREHVSRLDRTFGDSPFRSRIRSRSQSPFTARRYMSNDNFSRDLDSIFDSRDSFRARSTSPARFPRRGILKNARSDQNLNSRTRSSSPVFSSYTSAYTPSSHIPRSSNTTKKTVTITPTSTATSARDQVRSTATNLNTGITTRSVLPNTRYQIEISEAPPLTDEQRNYANSLIDKYTRPSCSLRTVNI